MLPKFKTESNKGSSRQAVEVSRGTFSVIGPDVVVSGSLTAKGDLHIEGRVEGEVTCHKLMLGETGHVTGTIVVDEVVISGEVNGPITARHLVLEKIARIKGDIACETMSMQAGAHIEGRLTMRNSENGLKLVAAE